MKKKKEKSDADIRYENVGSREECAYQPCDNKPTVIAIFWTSNTEARRIYCCDQHHNTRAKLVSGYSGYKPL